LNRSRGVYRPDRRQHLRRTRCSVEDPDTWGGLPERLG
jgi:hypothetical protein